MFHAVAATRSIFRKEKKFYSMVLYFEIIVLRDVEHVDEGGADDHLDYHRQ